MNESEANRLGQVDFLRGIMILDMFLVHYRDSLQPLFGEILNKLVDYSDFAMEGFVLLGGFMVGGHYLSNFRKDRRKIVKRLLSRAFQILKLHYLMICTISLPLAVFLGQEVTVKDSIREYMLESFLFLNQVGLLHILPTFIPLFIIAVPILFLLDQGKENIVLIASLALFLIGNFNPYIFTIGERSIFPVVLWQIYFVGGILLGKREFEEGSYGGRNLGWGLFLGIGIFCITAAIYFGHHLFPQIGEFKSAYSISVNKFPLNFLGFLYRGSILLIVCTSIVLLWSYISRLKTLVGAVELLGRHSLPAFVIHVYFAKAVMVWGYLVGDSFPFPQIIIFLNVCFTLAALQYIEVRKRERDLAKRSYLSRIYKLVS